MTKKERLKKIFPILKEKFGEPKAALEFETPYQLMIAVILSAQCTDARVNIVTKELFKVVKEPADIRKMNQETLEKYIKSTGFYKNKAKNIKRCFRGTLEHSGRNCCRHSRQKIIQSDRLCKKRQSRNY